MAEDFDDELDGESVHREVIGWESGGSKTCVRIRNSGLRRHIERFEKSLLTKNVVRDREKGGSIGVIDRYF